MGVIVLKQSILYSSLLLAIFFIAHLSANEDNLSTEQVSNLFKLPLSCVEVEYPNKLGQVLKSQDDLLSPKQLHPSFYGCFDWHSSVHGHWSLVRLLRSYPNIENAENAKNILKKHLTVENIQREVDYLRDNPSWERPYGWAWLLKLASEIKKWNDPVANGLGVNLQPLADEISRIAQTTQFNGVNVLDGTYQDRFFQIGANSNQNVGISIGDLGSAALGLGIGSGIFQTLPIPQSAE